MCLWHFGGAVVYNLFWENRITSFRKQNGAEIASTAEALLCWNDQIKLFRFSSPVLQLCQPICTTMPAIETFTFDRHLNFYSEAQVFTFYFTCLVLEQRFLKLHLNMVLVSIVSKISVKRAIKLYCRVLNWVVNCKLCRAVLEKTMVFTLRPERNPPQV